MLFWHMLAMQVPKTGKGKKGKQPVNKDRFAATTHSIRCCLSVGYDTSGCKRLNLCKSTRLESHEVSYLPCAGSSASCFCAATVSSWS